ncbi:FAD-dependent monooxygenase [Kineococcus rubinsiae]|uniref:FAD-dependent monooxygenase n=1 Tax=Kineococcus rubinsiae TaxID=2609562 RepID=UPI0014302607|nr:FAD-dependent monooxygenase [Kineococcus rubinsiae]NIZ90266.1 FAD-binding monooxygenase [Kineococcus rubinsiae]
MSTVSMDDLPVEETDVLVVGAGPTGLMAGLVLSRRGVTSVVIDQKAGPTRESRALAVQARTMEIYDQLGLVEDVIAGAYLATGMQLRAAGEPAALDLGPAQRPFTRYPGIHIFEQSRNEELLSSALAAVDSDHDDVGDGGREERGVRWQHRLLHLDDHTDRPGGRVEALLEGPGGRLVRVRARWCIGADGAGSAVRGTLNLPFEGTTNDAVFWVADLRGVQGLPENSLAARMGKASFALLFPLGPDGHARVVSMVNGDSAEQTPVLAAARTDLGLEFTAVEWFSTYRVHHRVAAHFARGSVFLAGDAAHVHSPVGGQGMNTGLQDAHDLANLLADVTHGFARPDALPRYERERRAVAVHLVEVTDRAFGLVSRSTRGTAWIRRRAVSLIGPLAPKVLSTSIGARVAGWLGQYRIHYSFAPEGAPTPPWATDRAVGRRLPPAGDNTDALRSFTWQLHSYGNPVERPDAPSWIEGPRDFGVDPAARLRPDRLYLIRPDGFVAASLPVRGGVADAAALRSAARAHQLAT